MNFVDVINGVLGQMQQMVQHYDPLNHATQLATDWKGRINNIVADLKALKKHNEKLLREQNTNRNNTEQEKEKEQEKRRDIIDFCDNSLGKMVKLGKARKIFTYDDIEIISNIEKQIYQYVVTAEVRDKLEYEHAEHKTFKESEDRLWDKVDSMWDDGASEESIKEYIAEEVRKIFVKSYNEEEKVSIIEQLFIQMTAHRNVRVFLSSEQMTKLLSSDFQCQLSNSAQHKDEECATCFDKFEDNSKDTSKDIVSGEQQANKNKEELDQQIIYLPCEGSHRYHYDCILPWLKKSVFCPKCKFDIREKL